MHNPVGHFGNEALMRHDDHCHPGSVDFAQQLHDLDRRLAIERSRRFVGQNHLRLRNQSAGNGYPLLLPARYLIGHVFRSVFQPDTV